MPKIPSKVSIEELVQNVEASSIALGEKATHLSEVILEIDNRLREMPGKTAVAVNNDDVKLSFDRLGGVWALWVIDGESPNTPDGRARVALGGISIPRKARAFLLLPQLLRKIDEEQTLQVKEIDKAFKSLDDFKSLGDLEDL